MGKNQEHSQGIIYVATNKYMPDIVKIGQSNLSGAQGRIRGLWGTGVPVPFDVVHAVSVDDEEKRETQIKRIFKDQQVHPKREFFKIKPQRVIDAMEMVAVDDVTAIVRGEVGAYEAGLPGSEDLESLESLESLDEEDKSDKCPPLDFDNLDIPVGATLVFKKDAEITATVTSGRCLNYEGADFFPSKLTGALLGVDYYPPAGPHWVYEDKLLQDIYDEVHKGKDSEINELF